MIVKQMNLRLKKEIEQIKNTTTREGLQVKLPVSKASLLQVGHGNIFVVYYESKDE